MPNKFWNALVEGTLWFALGVSICFCWAYKNQAFHNWQPSPSADSYVSGLLTADFARRWDGTCSGWTPQEAMIHTVGNLMHWWSYCTIAFVFWRLHPPLKTVPYSSFTLTLVGWFIMGCGISHLFSLTTVFYPAYRVEGLWLIGNGIISCIGTVFVAYSLVKAFEVVHAKRLEVEKIRKQFEAMQMQLNND